MNGTLLRNTAQPVFVLATGVSNLLHLAATKPVVIHTTPEGTQSTIAASAISHAGNGLWRVNLTKEQTNHERFLLSWYLLNGVVAVVNPGKETFHTSTVSLEDLAALLNQFKAELDTVKQGHASNASALVDIEAEISAMLGPLANLEEYSEREGQDGLESLRGQLQGLRSSFVGPRNPRNRIGR